MAFAGGAVGSDPEAAALSPVDPKITNRLSNGKNRKLFIACLLMVKVVNGRKHVNYVKSKFGARFLLMRREMSPS
jgi:hypothetical protein